MASITTKEIDHYKQLVDVKRVVIEKNEKYAYGENTISEHPKKENPDNRINVPLGKSTVTDVVGYAGRPGEIHTEYVLKKEAVETEEESKPLDLEDRQDDLTKLLTKFDEHNKEGLENSELLTTSISLGVAWELWWVSDELGLLESDGVFTPEYKIVDNKEVIPVYNNSLKPNLEKFLRFYTSLQDGKKVEHCDVYYPGYWESYKKEGSIWVEQVKVNDEGEVLTKTYPYLQVPVIPFRSSMRNEPIFNAQKKIMDGYDSIVSKTQNEVDRFNALIALFPNKVDKKKWSELSEALKPFMDDLDQFEKWPAYLNKDLSGVSTFYPAQADRLLNDYYRTIKVPDMSDEKFAGNQSGVALAFKLLGLEFLVSEIELYFRPGLEKRFEFYKDIIEFSTITNIEWDNYEQLIIWNRNLPVDKEAVIRMAAMLKGLGYSSEAINRFVPNSIIDAELEAEIEENEEEESAGMNSEGNAE